MCVVCFFFKQKTAYEMRISDWSSDVCSSDLRAERGEFGRGETDEIKLARARIGHIIEDGRLGSGRKFARLAEMFRRERGRGGIGHGKALVRSAADVIRADAPESPAARFSANSAARRSEEHTSELQSLMRISYAVFCLK